MTEISALVFEFIRRHKTVIEKFNEGKLEQYIKSLCSSYYGCACGNFHFISSPKSIEISGERGSKEYKLTQRELCSMITDFLQEA